MKTTIKILLLMLSTFILNTFNPQTTKAQCHIDDWNALEALYDSTLGDFWFNRTGWDAMINGLNNPPANCNLANLYGVTLDGNGRVEILNLISNRLDGNIPPEIDGLSNLIELNLSYNQLEGNIPIQLSSLSKLKILNLDSNELTGNIPAQLSNLSFLEEIWLRNNMLTGLPVELSNLDNLVELKLSTNQITGSVPQEFGNFNALKELYLDENLLTGNIPPSLRNINTLTHLILSYNELSGNIPPELGDLDNLYVLGLKYNQLSGCYDSNLHQLCGRLFDGVASIGRISNGNNFEASWEDFCNFLEGICCGCTDPTSCNFSPLVDCDFGTCQNCEPLCGCTDPNACNYNNTTECDDGSCFYNCGNGVYPGDLNNDGIVNNQDVSLSGLFQYNTGQSRAAEHQNSDWYPHPSQNWDIQNNQNKDIKHHDCNGDGVIDENDQQVVNNNMGLTWNTPSTQNPPAESDYQVMLHPIDQIYDGNLVMNVALERRAGGDLTLQGGHFTIDYSDVDGNFNKVALNFEPISWLGTPNIDLWYESTHFSTQKKIEVGFTKTDNVNSEGSGIIGQLILRYNSSAKRSNVSYNFEVNTIGVHQNNGNYIPIEDQQLQVNLNSACQANLTINENAPFQNLYKSSNNITTNGFVLIGADQEVEYNANRVRINSGFSVKAGAEFKVRNSGCN